MTNFFDECEKLVNCDRQADYGRPEYNLRAIAAMAEQVLDRTFTASDIALIFLCVKLCREGKNHKRDNLLDLACYAEILDRLEGHQ